MGINLEKDLPLTPPQRYLATKVRNSLGVTEEDERNFASHPGVKMEQLGNRMVPSYTFSIVETVKALGRDGRASRAIDEMMRGAA